MMLYLSRIHFPVTTLGPGRRIGIWFQGCSIRCKGCVSADTWGTGKGGVSIDEIMTVSLLGSTKRMESLFLVGNLLINQKLDQSPYPDSL